MKWELAAIFCALYVQVLAAAERSSMQPDPYRAIIGTALFAAGGVFMVVGLA